MAKDQKPELARTLRDLSDTADHAAYVLDKLTRHEGYAKEEVGDPELLERKLAALRDRQEGVLEGVLALMPKAKSQIRVYQEKQR